MHNAYKQDPDSVDSSWREFFSNVDEGKAPGEAIKLPPRTSKVCWTFNRKK